MLELLSPSSDLPCAFVDIKNDEGNSSYLLSYLLTFLPIVWNGGLIDELIKAGGLTSMSYCIFILILLHFFISEEMLYDRYVQLRSIQLSWSRDIYCKHTHCYTPGFLLQHVMINLNSFKIDFKMNCNNMYPHNTGIVVLTL